jgi:hypothetical protein
MAELISKNPRICYENGNSIKGKKIYEFQAFCTCSDCLSRKAWKNEPRNLITITIRDISKTDEAAEFLKKWTCENGKKFLKTAYFRF